MANRTSTTCQLTYWKELVTKGRFRGLSQPLALIKSIDLMP